MRSFNVGAEVFQSTLPMQGETLFSNLMSVDSEFQSTLPMQGETAKSGKKIRCPPDMGIPLNRFQ